MLNDKIPDYSYTCINSFIYWYRLELVMAESQNVEWKESWRDEYLKWICGFANAQGGTIYIGVNDNGDVVGLNNARKLLEDIPNKVNSTMGIISDINLLEKDGKEYIEIIVYPASYPVCYKGEYHYRSGSTKQLLVGTALTQFLLKKTGSKWDAIPVDGISVDDLDRESFDIFRKEARKSKRLSDSDLNLSNYELLKHLGLIIDGKLKRAAVLLFHREPETIITGAYTKIAKFNEVDIDYMDEVHGSLILQADRVIDLVYLKYLRMHISYEKDTRVETYPYAREALREAYFNALCHNDWSSGVPIQIRIDDCKLFVSNCCVFPDNWTVDTLMNDHESIPYNPDIANTFFRAGYIEAWGKGIRKICDACKSLGAEKPEYILRGRDVMVKFVALNYIGDKSAINSNQSAINSDKSAINSNQSAINNNQSAIKSEESAINDNNADLENNEISDASAYDLIVSYITDNGSITNSRAQEILKLKASRTRDILNIMAQLGLIVKVGNKKSTKYILPE